MAQVAGFDASSGVAGFTSANDIVQPALGQAIVENAILERRASTETFQVVRELNLAFTRGQRMNAVPNAQLTAVLARANLIDEDHAARVQYVAGRSLVDSTARGVRVGVLSPASLRDSYNRRIIETVEARINGLEDGHLNIRETSLGRAIVSAAQSDAAAMEGLQERLGTTMTRVMSVQEEYGRTLGEAQERLTSVSLAAVQSEQVADRFTQLAGAGMTQPAVGFSAPQSWPEVPISLLIGMSVGLIGIFFIGLSAPSPLRESNITAPEEEPMVYRKTA